MVQVWPLVLREETAIETVKGRLGKLLILVVIDFVSERQV
jgi:hypothetical protein